MINKCKMTKHKHTIENFSNPHTHKLKMTAVNGRGALAFIHSKSSIISLFCSYHPCLK